MYFCGSCGILLPLLASKETPVVGKQNAVLCRACKKQIEEKTTVCECDFCGKAQPREDILKYFMTPTPTASPFDFVGANIEIDNESLTPHQSRLTTGKPIQKKSKKESQVKRVVVSVGSSLSNRSTTNVPSSDWAECPPESESPSQAGMEWDCPKETLVTEEVREKWEREQAEFKRQLCKNDTPNISALVGGSRRKEDGSRYYLGGVDISFIKDNSVDACACLTVVQMPDLQMVYQRMEMIELTQPYIPGYLAFREVPALEKLYKTLEQEAPQYLPDIILVDGNGTLHPRGFGLACQLGVVLDIPTIGVAKTLISAQGITDDAQHKAMKRTLSSAGASFDLIADSQEVLGRCVRVHDKAPNPVYVSIGHRISLDSAVWVCLECSKYRIPEPVRRADLDSREYIRKNLTAPQVFIK